MARFARIDSQIRANRLILANRFRIPELNPFFANRASGGLKIVNRRFWGHSRKSLASYENSFFFFVRDFQKALSAVARIRRTLVQWGLFCHSAILFVWGYFVGVLWHKIVVVQGVKDWQKNDVALGITWCSGDVRGVKNTRLAHVINVQPSVVVLDCTPKPCRAWPSPPPMEIVVGRAFFVCGFCLSTF